jgi:hypothetical protein
MKIDLQYFIQQLKKRENLRFDSHVADHMGIDPKNLAMNKMRKVIPIKYIQWYCDKYNVERTKFERHIRGSGVAKTESEENVDYTIIAQRETIELQKEKIKQLENKLGKEPHIKNVYDGIQSDIRFSFKVKLNWSIKNSGIKVKYLSQDSEYIPAMAKKLGYTESEMIELLQIDEFVEYKNHKIHRLRTEKQKEEMIGIMDNFMNAYRSIKMNTTMLVAEIPVLYNHKNGTLFRSNVEYRVNWVKGTGTAHIRWCAE